MSGHAIYPLGYVAIPMGVLVVLRLWRFPGILLLT